jgi:hypothetical protein
VNLKVAVLMVVVAGGFAVMLVLGGVRSTFQVYAAGLPSTLPARSIARTRKVWLPALNPIKVCVLLHAAKAAPSSRHSKVLPASFDVNAKLALVLFVAVGGLEVIVVVGFVASTVHA